VLPEWLEIQAEAWSNEKANARIATMENIIDILINGAIMIGKRRLILDALSSQLPCLHQPQLHSSDFR
jgi:hypothetical protein